MNGNSEPKRTIRFKSEDGKSVEVFEMFEKVDGACPKWHGARTKDLRRLTDLNVVVLECMKCGHKWAERRYGMDVIFEPEDE